MGNNRLPSVPCTHGQHQQSTPVDTLCAILPPVCILPSPSAQVTFLLLSLSTELNTHHINTPSSPLPLFTVGFLFCFVLAPFYPLQRLSPCQSITYLFITPVACVWMKTTTVSPLQHKNYLVPKEAPRAINSAAKNWRQNRTRFCRIRNYNLGELPWLYPLVDACLRAEVIVWCLSLRNCGNTELGNCWSELMKHCFYHLSQPLSGTVVASPKCRYQGWAKLSYFAISLWPFHMKPDCCWQNTVSSGDSA